MNIDLFLILKSVEKIITSLLPFSLLQRIILFLLQPCVEKVHQKLPFLWHRPAPHDHLIVPELSDIWSRSDEADVQ